MVYINESIGKTEIFQFQLEGYSAKLKKENTIDTSKLFSNNGKVI